MKYDKMYMDIAKRVSQESYAKRLKVGAAILTENGGLFCGFNGTLPGFPNVCELDENTTDESITVHAEQNALYKMLKEGVSAKGATIYMTSSPCSQCAKMLISSGIKRVVYEREYRVTDSIEIMKKANLIVEKWEEKRND